MILQEFPNYRIEDNGQIWSFKSQKFLKPFLDQKGYLRVKLYHEGRLKTFTVHRLVALLYVDGYFAGATVDHIDSNKLNNSYKNLRWLSNAENVSLGQRKNPRIGSKNGKSKFTIDIIHEIRFLRSQGESLRRLGKQFQTSPGHISNICTCKEWRHVD